MTLKLGELLYHIGPNGTGKSALSAAIMSNPNFINLKGDILLMVKYVDLEVDERARLGFPRATSSAEIPESQMLRDSSR